MRFCVVYLDGGDGGDSATYDGSDHSVLLAFECEEGEARTLGDALDESEDGNGGERVSVQTFMSGRRRRGGR